MAFTRVGPPRVDPEGPSMRQGDYRVWLMRVSSDSTSGWPGLRFSTLSRGCEKARRHRPLQLRGKSSHMSKRMVSDQGFFSESIFIDQAALNGTRPNSPVGLKPAATPSGSLLYGSTPGMGPTPESVTGFSRWPSVSPVKKIVGRLLSCADGIAFQSLVDAMSSVWK